MVYAHIGAHDATGLGTACDPQFHICEMLLFDAQRLLQLMPSARNAGESSPLPPGRLPKASLHHCPCFRSTARHLRVNLRCCC
jgi:hypothetical protein